MAPEVHEAVPRAFPRRLHQFEKKDIDQAGEHEKTTTMLPVVKPWTLKSEFGFASTPHLLNLPASGGGKDPAPHMADARDRLVEQHTPRQPLSTPAATPNPHAL